MNSQEVESFSSLSTQLNDVVATAHGPRNDDFGVDSYPYERQAIEFRGEYLVSS